MTSMDTDSESQDSDDGRRFRFEATRKDAAIIPDTVSKEKSHRKKSKHRSHLEDKNYRDRKERSKHETSRKESQHSRERDIDEKESRHITKHAKYGTHKDYKSTKESDSTSVDKNLKYSMDSKDRLRDLKHSRERERNGHRRNSREHSRDRSYDDRSSVDRYRSKYHDRHKYSRHKSRDRSCHSNRLKLLDNDKSRNEHGRYDSIKKTKNKRLHPLENEHSAYENIEQIHDCNESHSMSLNKVCKATTPLDTQDCKDLDLRDFNVLSETDENISDISDSRSLYSSSYCHKTKVRREQLKNQYECVNKKQVAPDQEHVEELQKVNCKNNTPLLSSSNNNPSVISDTLLDSLEPTSIMNNQVQSLQEKDAKCDTFKYHSESSEKNNSFIYGPVLPPQIKTSQCTLNENKSTNLYTSLSTEKLETKECIVKDISEEDYKIALIGPCLPKMEDSSNNHENSNTMSALNLEEVNQEHQESHSASKNINEFVDDATAFGPALPPHLIKQPNEGDTKSKLIGPVIPENLKLLNEEERMAMYSQLEDEDSDTPSLTDYGATNTGQKYQELQTPGLHYFHEIKQEVAKDVVHKRETWMMELPPTRAADFGLRARKFRLRPGPDMSDRSCWTDTPEDKVKKRKAEEEAAALRSVKKPDSIELLKEKPKKTKKQEKSLLEIHQSKLKKRKKKEEKEAKAAGLPTRRPFDRNIDLQVNRFMDPSQKRSVLMKAGMLNDRFSRGQI
ncbi:PREDICTED: E3 ubiquitin-protein ligase Topors isoform X1 [Polistes canadensis]|uniref:E3 ubiquitin-protein ligase Topors isoform X1 n=2 Tax=Polistes canadensis TaxID=91411 RepID=UPI000718FFF5|nr:PREDICTED: E3 ubiquitin-protein ligase Topors isoform X1 [Polistes canadensis]